MFCIFSAVLSDDMGILKRADSVRTGLLVMRPWQQCPGQHAHIWPHFKPYLKGALNAFIFYTDMMFTWYNMEEWSLSLDTQLFLFQLAK